MQPHLPHRPTIHTMIGDIHFTLHLSIREPLFCDKALEAHTAVNLHIPLMLSVHIKFPFFSFFFVFVIAIFGFFSLSISQGLHTVGPHVPVLLSFFSIPAIPLSLHWT
ncbi:hypothetical protein B0T12DRAFT_425088 [Alternaria alternata]|nr:hypothetical protein B0T12DRAFT_425088 [Alternaria alternata]